MIVVTGAKGQLGSDICKILKKEERDFLPIDIDELDLTDKDAVKSFFKTHKNIDCVVHCAAYTAVDKAEDEAQKCFDINAYASEILAYYCEKIEAKMLYVSTDYVFGSNGENALETDDEAEPLNAYGKSKFVGEVAVKHFCTKHFIVRTSWVFGEKNTNFIATMLRLSENHESLNVVCDQIGSPTYSKHLAALICELIKTEKYGTYHATNEGYCSWSELAEEAFKIAGKSTKVIPVSTEEYGSKTARPLNSRLSKKSLDEASFERLPHWKDAVKEYLGNIGY